MTSAAGWTIWSTSLANRSQVALSTPRFGFTDIARDDLEVVGGQLAESLEQNRIPAVEGRLEPCTCRGLVASAHDRDQRAARLRQPFQQVEGEEAPEPAVRTGQQDGLGLAGHIGDRGGGGQRGFGSMNLSSVRSPARTEVAPRPCTLANVGRFEPDSRSVSM